MPDPMIVCASANPAMDRRLRVARLGIGEINRADSAEGFAGGKAAHVAMAARAMAGKAAWIGFLGGAIGQECARQLENLGIQVVAIRTAASTRVNLEIIDASGKITEILEPGSKLAVGEKAEFLRVCAQRIREEWKDAVLVISGSLPAGVDAEFYASLIETARAAGARIFVDTSGEALRGSIEARPDFVKTNRAEAEALFGRRLGTIHEIARAAKEIIQRGARSAAITMGREGFIWIEHENGPAWMARPPRVKVISTVGCGDATLGGFACAAVKGIVGEPALRLAAACGAANCQAAAPGRIERAVVESLLPQIEVQRFAL